MFCYNLGKNQYCTAAHQTPLPTFGFSSVIRSNQAKRIKHTAPDWDTPDARHKSRPCAYSL